MENATDALMMAFAVMVLVIALSLSITMFSRANQVSEVVLSSSDVTTYYNYYDNDKGRYRIVGLETIIPTLYKYYKENYTVLFLQKNGNPLGLYKSKTLLDNWGPSYEEAKGNIGKYYTQSKNNYAIHDTDYVCAFDLQEETVRREPWTATTQDCKENLDAFLYGGKFVYKNGSRRSI